jgi:hypothetical protein
MRGDGASVIVLRWNVIYEQAMNQFVERTSPCCYLSREAAMTRKRILLLLAFAGSAVCWWPDTGDDGSNSNI